MPRLKCKNVHCKFNEDEKKCNKKSISIGSEGKCSDYEPGFPYYFFYYATHTQSNFLTMQDVRLHPEYKYSIYYMTKCLPIDFLYDDVRGIVVLQNKKTKAYVSADDIWDLVKTDVDDDALEECIRDFITNGLPKSDKDAEPPKVEEQEYGWLSPSGDFYPSEWGTHEIAAADFCEKYGFEAPSFNYGDALSNHGWCLIHDPANVNRYIVTHQKDLTKNQRDFLYGYFKDMGMTGRAETYLKDSE